MTEPASNVNSIKDCILNIPHSLYTGGCKTTRAISHVAGKALIGVGHFFTALYQHTCHTASWLRARISSVVFGSAALIQNAFRRVFPLKTPKPIHVSAPLTNEVAHVPLRVDGSIPNWLSGTLIRNGAIPVTVNGKSNKHQFDGLAMLHSFSFNNGQVSYTNQFLRSDAYNKVFKEGSINYSGFAEDPCRSVFKRFLSLFQSNLPQKLHNANVNVAKLANRFVALTEQPLPIQFDFTTLNTLGVLNYQDKLPKKECWESAHPHYDPIKHQTLNYLVKFGRQSYYTLYSLDDGSSERKIIAEIPVKTPSYMHSFAVTENYVVFTEFPFVVNPLSLLLTGKAFIQNFQWKPDLGTQFTVVNRHNGEVKGTYKTKPFFAFHHANAFEQNGQIHIDMVTYKDASIITGLNTNAPTLTKNSHPSQLERFSLATSSNTLSSEVLLPTSNEFPRINEKYDGQPYRYLYVTRFDDSRGLHKINTATKESLAWSAPDCSPGEPIFVADPNGIEEDDGVILSLVLDEKNKSSFLVVLDAKTFKELGRATAPHLIPKGLHGQYFQ